MPLAPGWPSDKSVKLWDRAGETIQGRFAPLYWVAPGTTFEGDVPPQPPQTRTTAEAETLITQLVTTYGAVSRTLTTTFNAGTASGWSVVTVNAASSGSMWGTPWGNRVTTGTALGRVILHSLPSAAAYSFLQTNTLRVLLQHTSLGSGSTYPSLNRNGFTSSSWTTDSGFRFDKIIYYSQDLQNLAEINPFTLSSPVIFNP